MLPYNKFPRHGTWAKARRSALIYKGPSTSTSRVTPFRGHRLRLDRFDEVRPASRLQPATTRRRSGEDLVAARCAINARKCTIALRLRCGSHHTALLPLTPSLPSSPPLSPPLLTIRSTLATWWLRSSRNRGSGCSRTRTQRARSRAAEGGSIPRLLLRAKEAGRRRCSGAWLLLERVHERE